MGKLSFIKIRNFNCVKNTVKRMKRKAVEWSKIFAKYIFYKTLVS